jgi:DNA-binding NarL/FixJ family response regulator
MPTKIALVDDNFRLIDALAQNLRQFEEVELLFMASDGAEALTLMQENLPDIVLMDIEMDGMDGITTTQEIKKLYPSVKIIILTVYAEDDKIFQAIQAGATGYLLKDEKYARIVDAIESTMAGDSPMSPIIARRTLQLIRLMPPQNTVPQKTINYDQTVQDDFNLTKREVEILKLIAEGTQYNQIAEKLFLSSKTVSKHVQNIYEKLQIHSRAEAMQFAYRQKLVKE